MDRRDPDDGWRLYLLLALFDARDGTYLSELVRTAREGYERSDPDMGRDENLEAWDEFDRLWNRHTSGERLELASLALNQKAATDG